MHVERGQSRLVESGAIVRTLPTDSAVDAARALEGGGGGGNGWGSGGGENGKGGAPRAGFVLNVFHVHLANNVNVSTSGRQLVASIGMLGAPRTCSPTIGTLRCPQHSILILISQRRYKFGLW